MNNRNTLRISLFQLVRVAALLAGGVLLAVAQKWVFAAILFIVLATKLGSDLPGRFGAISRRVLPFAPGLSKAQRVAFGLVLLVVVGMPLTLIQDRRPETVAITAIVVSGVVAWLLWMIRREGWSGEKSPGQ